MRVVDMKCPNCGGRLSIEDNRYVCNFCGSSASIDYDESDVAYERIKNEDKERAHQKEMLERQYELQQQAVIEAEQREWEKVRKLQRRDAVKTWIARIIALGIFFGICVGIYMVFLRIKSENGSYSGANILATPTPEPNYNITPDDVKIQMTDFIKSGMTKQKSIDQCAYWDHQGGVDFYDKADCVFVDAYIVTDIPEVDKAESNRLVLFYEITWHNEDEGDQICYDAVYFEGIRVNPNGGGVITDFDPRIIDRSDAAWGWSMAYSFEEYDQCYRENITALGGKVTKVDWAVD